MSIYLKVLSILLITETCSEWLFYFEGNDSEIGNCKKDFSNLKKNQFFKLSKLTETIWEAKTSSEVKSSSIVLKYFVIAAIKLPPNSNDAAKTITIIEEILIFWKNVNTKEAW